MSTNLASVSTGRPAAIRILSCGQADTTFTVAKSLTTAPAELVTPTQKVVLALREIDAGVPPR